MLREGDAFIDGLNQMWQAVGGSQSMEGAGQCVAEIGRKQVGQELDAAGAFFQRGDHFVALPVGLFDPRHEIAHEPFEIRSRGRAALVHEVTAGQAVTPPSIGIICRRNAVGDPGDDGPGAHDHVDLARIGEAGANRCRNDVEKSAIDRGACGQAGFLGSLSGNAGPAFE